MYDSENEIGIIIWRKRCSSEEYRQSFTLLLEHQKKKGSPKFLSDIRHQSIVSPSDRKWFQEYALPEAQKNGLRKAAVITDANPFKNYYMNMILRATKKFNLPIRLFSSEETAVAWLNE